jgi:hypothetical protein
MEKTDSGRWMLRDSVETVNWPEELPKRIKECRAKLYGDEHDCEPLSLAIMMYIRDDIQHGQPPFHPLDPDTLPWPPV